MRRPLKAAGQLFLEAIFPGRCLLCGRWLLFEGDRSLPLCDACRKAVLPIGEPRCARCGMRLVSERFTCMRCRDADYVFVSNTSLFAYSGAARKLIGKLKFEGRNRLADLFAHFVAEVLRNRGESSPLVPVPPRPGRRTPDPVDRVARCLEHRHGIMVKRLLKRTGGVQQKSLDFLRRRENLRGMIQLAPGEGRGTLPSRVIILDDVFTTGATIDACARALREAGCEAVYAITLAIEE